MMTKIGHLTNLLTDKSLQLTLLGESKVENRPAVGVKAASKGHRDIDLFFDKESGLLAKIQSRKNDLQTMQEVDEERIIKEYQDIDGQKTPKKVLINHDGKKYLELDVLERSLVQSLHFRFRRRAGRGHRDESRARKDRGKSDSHRFLRAGSLTLIYRKIRGTSQSPGERLHHSGIMK